MRESFKRLTKSEREKLLENVLRKVKRCMDEREALRNLITDAVTPDNILAQILQYLMDNGYPLERSEEWAMKNANDWLRKAGAIRIPNPDFLLSIQKSESIISNLEKYSASLDSEFYGKKLSTKMSSQEFIEAIDEIVEARSINTSRMGKKHNKLELRSRKEDNLWITWNENRSDEVSDIKRHDNDRNLIFKLLGLGFYLKEPHGEFVGLVFNIVDEDIKIFRPGWGDANTYYYWQSIKDENAKYGYTKAIDLDSSYDQPEGVSKNANFHLDLLSDQSFNLK